jgi:hypothetical protein
LKSWNRGNGILGIRIHNIKDRDQKTDVAGANPFDGFKLPNGTLLSSVVKTYDWVIDDGRKNLGKWADEAAEIRAEYGTSDKITDVSESTGTSKAYTSSIRSSSASFAPKSPWCSTDAPGKR